MAIIVLLLGSASAMTIAILGIFGVGLFDRGTAIWRETAEVLRARGEPLDLAEVVPVDVAPANNFFYADALADWKPGSDPPRTVELFLDAGVNPAELIQADISVSDWAEVFRNAELVDAKKDYLSPGDEVRAALRNLELDFAGLHDAALRGASQFPTDYLTPDPPVPHLAPLERMAQWLAVDAVARLSIGDSGGAERAIFTIFRLAQALAPEPLMASQIARCRILMTGAGAIQFGVATNGWSSDELGRFGVLLSGLEPSKDFIFALRCERARLNSLVDQIAESDSNQPIWMPELAAYWLGDNAPQLKPGELRRRQAEVNLAVQHAIDGEPPLQESVDDQPLDLRLDDLEDRFDATQLTLNQTRLECATNQSRMSSHRQPQASESNASE